MYQRTAVEYKHKLNILNYMNSGYSLDATIAHFYGDLSGSDIRAKKKQINKWDKQRVTIQRSCNSGRSDHRNLRSLGDATVLSRDAEDELVLWVNSLHSEGAPVSRSMIQLQAKEMAADCELGGKFAASSTWIKLFLRRHRLPLRARTCQGQTTPEGAQEAAQAFQALVKQTIAEQQCVQVYNADQTAVNFEYLPKQTISKRGVKTVWIRCVNKEKARATTMLLADWEGTKHPTFLLFKSTPATTKEKQKENDDERHGFGVTVWKREIRALQAQTDREIYGNKCAWWNSELSLKFLRFHFADRPNIDENVLLLWDDFSGHWTTDVLDYAVARLRDQLVEYRGGAAQREYKRLRLQNAIHKARKELTQGDADVEVTRVHQHHTEDVFTLKPPGRSDITRWVSQCWANLSASTIINGFRKVSILNDTRVVKDGAVYDVVECGVVEELESCTLASGDVDSDDDIGSGDEKNSDSEDDA